MGTIRDNVEAINSKKEEVTARAGREPNEVLLIAVTKNRSADEINEAIDAGITDIGENKVQEIMDKYDKVKNVRWHMIGHLQSNKVKYIIDKVSLIHSVDSFKLAEEIDKRAAQNGTTMDILIQINAAREDSKYGITSDETEKLIEDILGYCKNIRIRGLMCVAPFEDDPEDVRVYFKEVKKLYDRYTSQTSPALDFRYLSMGMSHDFEAAIMEGSNLIRIGTAIFGERNYQNGN
ncbi:MAG: YggS family pyridoxal phosphate-dependent enzyme [Eubacteriales bacterium]|nr:YggS family pyridoxal phosphate-dependent enzyme [Eubacteriales bacterium]MDD3198925.1 YggS family pyridoxal phosphate-dependent enzyme [Eubacteriales bacterium]MDD4629588.1 YggS family pyridoxal phosphate-dependent enzyme [Eubacteriales bacterium]